MQIIADGLGKKFGRDWIYRNVRYTFETGKRYAVTGKNGSGKTTLLKALAGMMPLSEGSVKYQLQGAPIEPSRIFRHITFTTPSLELIEEFTLLEAISFYSKFRKLQLSAPELVARLGMEKQLHKQLKNFSSGMKQKVKLALALFSVTDAIMLDEPTTNLDKENMAWYKENVLSIAPRITLIISSNQEYEYDFCEEVLHMDTFKPTLLRS